MLHKVHLYFFSILNPAARVQTSHNTAFKNIHPFGYLQCTERRNVCPHFTFRQTDMSMVLYYRTVRHCELPANKLITFYMSKTVNTSIKHDNLLVACNIEYLHLNPITF